VKFDVAERPVFRTYTGFHRLDIGAALVCLFDQRSPLALDRLAVERVGIREWPPFGNIVEIFQRVTEEICEPRVYEERFFVRCSRNQHCGGRVLNDLPAQLFALAKFLFRTQTSLNFELKRNVICRETETSFFARLQLGLFEFVTLYEKENHSKTHTAGVKQVEEEKPVVREEFNVGEIAQH